MQPFVQAIAGSWKNWCSVANKYSTISLYGHPCYPIPSGDLSPSGLWVIFLAVVLIIPIFQCYWVPEYLLCVAGFLTNSLFPIFASGLHAFPFVTCPLLVLCASRHAPGFTLFSDDLLCPVLFISSVCVTVGFLSLFPCTDLASPSIKFLFLFSNLLLFPSFSLESWLSTVNPGWGNIIHFSNYAFIFAVLLLCHWDILTFASVHQQCVQNVGFPQLPMAMPGDCS